MTQTHVQVQTQRRRLSRRVVVTSMLGLAVVAAVIAITNPFWSHRRGSVSAADNASATALATVTRRRLSSQTQVSGTLGYAGSSTVIIPSGTSPSALRQQEQTAASAEATRRGAEALVAADSQTLEQARSVLTAKRLKQATDCRGDQAASQSTSACGIATSDTASAEEAVRAAEAKLTADSGSAGSAGAAAAGAEESLTAAASSALAYESGATYTALPSPGTVISRGQALFSISGRPVLLFYGRLSAWRAFQSGMSTGRDVAALNANLRALGYGEVAGDSFTDATAAAIRSLQSARGLPSTGELPLGSVVFEQGPVRVKSIVPSRGAAVQPGAVLRVTSTRHHVSVALDAAQQTEVKPGDKVTITLPDDRTTPGRVASVGKVASTGPGGTTTVDVSVQLSQEADAGRLDQAPVQVTITTGSVDNALAVPVTALLALAGGGYAVEVAAGNRRDLVPVKLGLFDDAAGLVQVTARGLAAGQQVVVPGS